MNLKQQNVLFFTRTMHLGGTENVVLQICEILNPLVNKIVVCSCGGVNVERLQKMGIKHYSISDIEEKKPNTVFNVGASLLRIVKNEEITVIHTHHRMAAFYVSLLRMYKNCIFINTSHNTFNNKKKLTAFAYKHAKLVACGGMVKKNLVSEFGLPSKQITVIHNSIKPFAGELVIDEKIHELHNLGYYIIGNIGRLSEQKGMEYFIKAIPSLLSDNHKLRFLIIGSGENEKKLKDIVTQLKIEDYVIFLGYRSDVQNIMSQLDLIVLSSLWEGFPLTPIEAYSVGKTIVATSVDGTVEIVEDGVDGILVEPKNIVQLAEKIRWLIQNPYEKLRMEYKARQKYDMQFSFERFGQQYIDVYENAIRSENSE